MWFPKTSSRAYAFVFLILTGACRKEPPSALVEPSPLTTREIAKDSALFFTYLDSSGVFATTEKAETVPAMSRGLVRIMGRGRDDGRWRNNAEVDVIDLRELLAHGKTRTQGMSRETFETRALAQLPPGDSCLLAGPHGPPLAEEPSQVPAPAEPPVVVLYGTAWCKACMTADQYLRSNRIPFAARDVERDPSAIRELREKATRLGAQTDRVPVLDVRGRLLVGFDRARMDGLLADW